MVHTMSAMQADTGVAERIVGRGGRSTYTNESISKERKFNNNNKAKCSFQDFVPTCSTKFLKGQ